jgi:hypothetical protein
MNIKDVVRALTATLAVCILAGAQVVLQQSAPEDPESLRQMLASQPDYTAVQRDFFLTEGSGSGMGLVGKVAKLGDKLAQVSESAILIREPGKPTIKVFPKRQEYAEMAAEKEDYFGGPPEEFTDPEKVAKRGDVVFKSAGVEKVGEYACVKIEVSPKDEKFKAVKLLFWAAPGLKNLVVQSEVSIARPSEGRVRYVTTLEDISLAVDEGLFRVPAGYKKVIEPGRTKGSGEKIRKPR